MCYNLYTEIFIHKHIAQSKWNQLCYFYIKGGVKTMNENEKKIDEELENTVETKQESEINDSNEESTNDKKKKIKILSVILAVIK